MSLPGSLAVTPKVRLWPSLPPGAVMAEIAGGRLAMLMVPVWLADIPSLSVTVSFTM